MLLEDGIYRVVAKINLKEVYDERIKDENEAKRTFCNLVNRAKPGSRDPGYFFCGTAR